MVGRVGSHAGQAVDDSYSPEDWIHEGYIEVVAEAFAVRWVLGYLTSRIHDGELY